MDHCLGLSERLTWPVTTRLTQVTQVGVMGPGKGGVGARAPKVRSTHRPVDAASSVSPRTSYLS